jgi:TM2 domain-containing membrane protein YozV
VKEPTSLAPVNYQTAILQVSANDYEDSKSIILPNPKKKKSPFLAIFLTFVWPGLGHVYNGQIWPGLILMSFSWFFLFGTSPLILAPVYWLLGNSAFNAAMDLHEGRPIHKWMKKVKPKGRTMR